MPQVAARRGVDPEELFDAHTGFRDMPRSSDGTYLARRGFMELDPDAPAYRIDIGCHWRLRLLDGDGDEQLSFALPRPTDGADRIYGIGDSIEAAHREWHAVLHRVVTGLLYHARRIETALATRRPWKCAVWKDLFLRHPILRIFAAELIWGLLPSQASDAYTALFRPLPDGTLVDVGGGVSTPPAEGTVRLVHPLELDGATCARWKSRLAGDGIHPFMRQLDRPLYTMPDELRAVRRFQTVPIRQLFRRPGYAHGGSGLFWHDQAQHYGWQGEASMPNDSVETVWKTFHTLGVEAALQRPVRKFATTRDESGPVTLMFAPIGSVGPATKDRRVLATDDPRLLPCGQVPPIAYSEVMYDIARLAAGGYYCG